MDEVKLKVEGPHCDGVHHRWSYTAPVRCLGCGHRFSDLSDLALRNGLSTRIAKERD